MAILVLQHSEIVGPGRFGATLRDNGHKLDIRTPHRPGHEQTVPKNISEITGLVILGGPANVTDIATLPWMQAEAELIRMAHAAKMPVVGICLGAQLIAHALGGQVAPKAAGPDLGFFPMSINTTGQVDTLLSGIQWSSHQLFSCGQEITQLPPGATLLASTPSTKNACFKAGLRTLACLFHFECDREMTSQLLTSSPSEMAAAGKTKGDLEAQISKHYDDFARLSDRLCVNLATYCFHPEGLSSIR